MYFIRLIVEGIDRVNLWVGKTVKWMLLAATLLSASNALIRKFFGISSNGMLEAQWYFFASVFLLGAAYAFQQNSHVRIDFLSARFTAKKRNLIDAVGICFILIPFCVFMISLSWGLFSSAWSTNEMSSNAGGLVRWPVYLLIPAGFALLLLQAVAELSKRTLFLLGKMEDSIPEDHSSEDSVAAVEFMGERQPSHTQSERS